MFKNIFFGTLRAVEVEVTLASRLLPREVKIHLFSLFPLV